MTRRMYDAAYPPSNPPTTDAVAFYIGGDTPHPWSDAEINRQRARYRLPIYVRSNPSMSLLAVDVAKTIAWLKAHKVPHGSVVALDLETAVHSAYVHGFDAALTAAGYRVVAYGSLSTIYSNPRPSGGYWVAHYTYSPHMESGAVITQWADGSAYDSNLVADSVPLWDTHAPAPTPTPPPDEEIDMAQRDLLPGLASETGLILPPKTGGYTEIEFGCDNSFKRVLPDGTVLVKSWDPIDLRVVIRRHDGSWQHVEPFTVGRAAKDTNQKQWKITLDDHNSTYVSVVRLTGAGDEPMQVCAY